MQAGLGAWIRRLGATVDTGALDGLDAGSFADERGHRRSVDGLLIAWLRGVRPEGARGFGVDLELWDALAGGGPVDAGVWCSGGALQDPRAPGRGEVSIEVWTERELSAIQALWALGVERGNAGWRERAEAAARWCVEELQPDNATGHPWGVNAFAALAAGGDFEADLYAQTLLHNAQVGLGRPGRFANLVLLASLRSLEAFAGDQAG